jgi:hypothetical protein
LNITYISFSLGDFDSIFLEAHEKLLRIDFSIAVECAPVASRGGRE